jgi:hypothetical protein
VATLGTRLDDRQRAFIAEQKVFFTASAPPRGRINLSPKGMDTFRCLDDTTVAYLDLTGSGNETAAHLLADGRLTLMFCSFTEQPRILRLAGRGRLCRPGDEAWERLSPSFPTLPGQRQIVILDIETVQTSCGFGVPVAAGGLQERPTLYEWAVKKGEDGLRTYRAQKNVESVDGLPTGEPG